MTEEKGFLKKTPEMTPEQEKLLLSYFGVDELDTPVGVEEFYFSVPSGPMKSKTLGQKMAEDAEHIPESTIKQMFGDELPTEVVVIKKENIRRPFVEGDD